MMPFEQCPRFERCCVNVCPLHPNYKKLKSADSDPEQKCTLPKSIRKRLGVSLAWKGMTEKEISGAKRWDSLPENVKQTRIANLKERSLFVRLSKKGYAVMPKPQNLSKNTLTKQATLPLESPLKSNLNILSDSGDYPESPSNKKMEAAKNE